MTFLDRRALLLALSGGAFASACRTVTGSRTAGADAGSIPILPVMRRRWVPGEKAEYKDKYIKAVGLLKANDAKFGDKMDENIKDPDFFLSWRGIVYIHEKSCQHKNWYLLPYHRLYLLYFEAACQAVLEDSTFAVPYWDWTQDRAVPSEFYEVDVLMTARDLKKGDMLPETSVGRAALDKFMLSKDFFAVHSGRLNPMAGDIESPMEMGPHDEVHNRVGGIMGDPSKSPTDPIFWMHHGNLDRLWSIWLAQNAESVAAQLTLSPAEKKADPRRKFSWGDSPIGLDLRGRVPSGWEGYEDMLLQLTIAKINSDQGTPNGGGGGIPFIPGIPGGGLGGGLGGGSDLGGFPGAILGGPGVFTMLPVLPGGDLPPVTKPSNETTPEKPVEKPKKEILTPEQVMQKASEILEETLRKQPAPALSQEKSHRGANITIKVKDMISAETLPYYFDTDAQLAAVGPTITAIVRNPSQVTVKPAKNSFVQGKGQISGARFISTLKLDQAVLKKITANSKDNFAKLTYFNVKLPEGSLAKTTSVAYFVVESSKVSSLPKTLPQNFTERPDYVGIQNFFLTHNHSLFDIDHTKFSGSIPINERLGQLFQEGSKGDLALVGVAVNVKTMREVPIFHKEDETGIGIWLTLVD